LLLAWAAARFFPRRAARPAAASIGVLIAAFVIWGLRSLQLGDTATEAWLRSFYARMSFVELAFLPNNWVASGIDRAIHNQLGESLLYLGVTVANAFFLSWLAVTVVARYLSGAHDRASAGRGSTQRMATTASGGPAGLIFAYLPLPLRLIAAKDLRTFLRDPMQWTQLAILFGLLVLYLTNMPTLRLHFGGWEGWSLIIPFLNLCAISLILATFTCRFVFPLVSLEGQKLWMIGLLPMPRSRVLLAKFAFAMTVTLSGAIGAMLLATIMLKLNWVWALVHLVVVVAICFGLCGFAVGIGARLPMLREQEAARIANGLGGTTNLLASLALVAMVLAVMAAATWRSRERGGEAMPDVITLCLCLEATLMSIVAGLAAMRIGAKHFGRVEV
jgi:ABC-2 type transport system permease protein